LQADVLVAGSVETPNEGFAHYGGKATAVLQGSATLGTLKASARTEVSANVSMAPNLILPDYYLVGFGAAAYAGGQAVLGWGDVVTVTSETHALGEAVPFELMLYLDRTIQTIEGINPSAYVYSDLVLGTHSLSIADSNSNPSNVIWQRATLYLPVGESIAITGQLSIATGVLARALLPDRVVDTGISSADASHTANYYLTPLVEGVSYTSASGRTYIYPSDATPVPTPALLPGLVGLGLNL
jgi:hypothetical protein